jgi:hypothetical protein
LHKKHELLLKRGHQYQKREVDKRFISKGSSRVQDPKILEGDGCPTDFDNLQRRKMLIVNR